MGATLPTVALPDIMLIAPAPDRGPGKANAHRRDGADRIRDCASRIPYDLAVPKPSRAVLYGRVSRDRGGEGQPVDGQLTDLRRLAAQEEWRVVAEHRDDGIGASRYSRGDREEWRCVLDLIEDGAVDVLACRSLSRASRDRKVFATLFEACERTGVHLHAGGRYMDPAQPEDAFGLDVEAAFAVRAAATISKDTRLGQAKAAERGRPHGPTLWPYRRVYNDRGALERVEVIPERAAALREAASSVLAGGTLTAAAEKINAAGLDPGRQFLGRTLRRLLCTPTTAGLRVHRRQVVGDGDWPPILDVETHRQLVQLLSQPDRRCTRDNQVRHLLPGVALCGRCGATMHRIGGTQRPPRLVCSDQPHLSLGQGAAEEYVSAVVVARLQLPDALAAWQPQPAQAASNGRETLAVLRGQLAGWEDAAAEGTLTPAAFGRIEARLLARIAAAEAAARPVQVPAVLAALTAGDVPTRWTALPSRRQREVLRLLGAPTIHPGRGPAHERVTFPWEGQP